jgi:hypothetical protein
MDIICGKNLLLGHTPEDAILHSHRRENLKFYIALTGCVL